MTDHSGTGGRMRVAVLATLLPAITGCNGRVTLGAICNDPGLLPLWLIVPIACGLLGAIVVFANRTHQLDRWDLSNSGSAPRLIVNRAFVGAAVLAFVVAFPFFMLLAEPCDPGQRRYNVVAWLIGGVLGVCFSLAGGLWANRRYSKGLR